LETKCNRVVRTHTLHLAGKVERAILEWLEDVIRMDHRTVDRKAFYRKPESRRVEADNVTAGRRQER
jgi:hypothetical protein